MIPWFKHLVKALGHGSYTHTHTHLNILPQRAVAPNACKLREMHLRLVVLAPYPLQLAVGACGRPADHNATSTQKLTIPARV
jgi:hypothetical protein